MQRHKSLAPLSREHHETLILARLLQTNAPPYKNLPDTPEEKMAYALNLFETTILRHFMIEEAMLTRVASSYSGIVELASEILAEHQEISNDFSSLRHAGNLVETLNSLGVKLEKHIRKEERVLFPMIQDHCSEEVLNEVFVLLTEKGSV
ncbi:MAG TPA: hemerythrin domain-containing protein [Flavitalea sp.]|nr:hemerythrin domain-containing protein [Flavitalea sp.]